MVQVLGHRGERQNPDVDENTLPTFATGFSTSDGIETDGTQTKDGTVFLSHDTTQDYIPHVISKSRYVFNTHLNKISQKILGKRRIDQLTDAEMEALTLEKGGKVPKLSEVFAEAVKYPGKTIDIEVKGEHAIEPIIAEIHKAVAAGEIKEEQIIITSFNHPAILRAKQLAPKIKRGLIFSGSSIYDSRMFPWSHNKESRYIEFNEKSLTSKQTREIAPDYFIVKHTSVTPENVSLLRKHFPQGKIMFWTSNEKPPAQNDQVIKALTDPATKDAIEAVITDYPEQMTKLLKAKGLKA